MSLHLPAPRLVQGADEDVILEMAAIIFPGFLKRVAGEKSLSMELEGDYRDEALAKNAADRFQVLLGVLRAWRPIAGQRADEVQPGLGQGAIRDEHGNQLILATGVHSHSRFGDDVEAFASDARDAIEKSERLASALLVYGRRDLDAAALYNVYEFARLELGDDKRMSSDLELTGNELARFTQSANNLPATQGGRHAKGTGSARMDLGEQKSFIARLLSNWIRFRARLDRGTQRGTWPVRRFALGEEPDDVTTKPATDL